MARIKLRRTKILIDKSKMYNPRNDPIRLTGNATAGELYFVVSYIQNANVS